MSHDPIVSVWMPRDSDSIACEY